jgi:hypothetical protein
MTCFKSEGLSNACTVRIMKIVKKILKESVNTYTLRRIKGTVARDCRPLDFFNNRPNMGP